MPDKTYYIKLDFDSVLEALAIERFAEGGELNGSYGVHIQPGYLEYAKIGLKKDNPYQAKVAFRQRGNYYAPDAGYISQFGVMGFFDEDLLAELDMGEELSEIRSEARKDWAWNHSIDRGIVDDNFLNKDWEHYEAVQKEMDEWEKVAVDYFRDLVAENRLVEVIDERFELGPDGKELMTGYRYVIEWI